MEEKEKKALIKKVKSAYKKNIKNSPINVEVNHDIKKSYYESSLQNYEALKKFFHSERCYFENFGIIPALAFTDTFFLVMEALEYIKSCLEVLPEGTIIKDLSESGEYDFLDCDFFMAIVNDYHDCCLEFYSEDSDLPLVHGYYFLYDYDFVCNLYNAICNYAKRLFSPTPCCSNTEDGYEENFPFPICVADDIFLHMMRTRTDEFLDHISLDTPDKIETGYALKYSADEVQQIIDGAKGEFKTKKELKQYAAELCSERFNEDTWYNAYICGDEDDPEDYEEIESVLYHDIREMMQLCAKYNIPYRIDEDSNYNIKNWFKNYYNYERIEPTNEDEQRQAEISTKKGKQIMYYIVVKQKMDTPFSKRSVITVANKEFFADLEDEWSGATPPRTVMKREAFDEFLKKGYQTKDEAANDKKTKQELENFIGPMFQQEYTIMDETELKTLYETLIKNT